ncbi:hypothetical protein RP20_CCG026327 [Aedes albopictus]|nr:hypothetical protein RP20_CCG026327 [Aedes albopictus]
MDATLSLPLSVKLNSPGLTERNNLQSVGASSSTSAPLTRTSSQAEQSVATIAKKLSATLRRIPAEFKAELEVNHIRKVDRISETAAFPCSIPNVEGIIR